MTNYVDIAKRANHCQRNWDYTQPIPKEDIDTIVNTAVNMPTKQSLKPYKLLVSDDLDFNHEFYKLAIDPENKKSFDRPLPHRNTQVYAPLLLIFIRIPLDLDQIDPNILERSHFDQSHIVENNTHYSVSAGIASGTAAFTARQMGYSTGYCQCFDHPNVSLFFKEKNIEYFDYIDLISLGIGKPLENYQWTDIVYNNEFSRSVPSYEKQIDVQYYEKI